MLTVPKFGINQSVTLSTDLISYEIKSQMWFAPYQDSLEINNKFCILHVKLNFPIKHNFMKLQSNLKQENVDEVSNSGEIYEEKLS